MPPPFASSACVFWDSIAIDKLGIMLSKQMERGMKFEYRFQFSISTVIRFR